MSFKSLRTERLVIRRLQPGDADALAGYRSLPEVTRFQSSYSVERAKQLIAEMSDSDPTVSGKWFQFAVELSSMGRLIGDVGFLNTDDNGKSWVGFTLDPTYWRQGFAAEAVKTILAYYGELGISDVWASIDPKNETSMRLLKKLGFKMVEEKPDDIIFLYQP